MFHFCTRVAVLAGLALLSGCSDPNSPKAICGDNPAFCEDLNQDGWCRTERAELLIARRDERIQANDANKHRLLLAFEDYRDCIHPVTSIEPKKNRELKQQRMQGYVTSVQEIRRLVKQTRSSEYPPLLVYHWSREQSTAALEKLLSLEGTEAMQTPKMQLALASYYIKIDTDKAIDQLYAALEMYNKDDQNIDNEIFITLSSAFYQEQKFKQAYVWARIAQMLEAENVNLEPIAQQLNNANIPLDALDELAEETLSAIQGDEFVAPHR